MKGFIDISAEEKKQLLRWALKNDRVDMWNDKGVFKSNTAVAYIFRAGLERAMRDLGDE